MQVKDYWQLTDDDRLALLRALVHTAVDTEVVRQHVQDTSTELMNESLSRGLPLGVDDTGTSYYQLASDAGIKICAQKLCSSIDTCCGMHHCL